MTKHNTGFYCWVGGLKSWHRTYKAANKKATLRESQGYTTLVQCCKCGEDAYRCRCDQDPSKEGGS